MRYDTSPQLISNYQKKEMNATTDNKPQHSAATLTTVLLSRPEFSAKQYVQNLKADWGFEIPATDIGEENGSVVTMIGGMMVSVFMTPVPVEDGKAEREALTNYLWDGAVTAAKEHKAYVTVTVQHNNTDPVVAATLAVKLTASILRQAAATAVLTCGTVMSPRFYSESAASGCEGHRVPVMNLVYFGVSTENEGQTMNGYTFGLSKLGCEEVEILNSLREPQEIFEMLTTAATYMLDYHVKLKNGDTIGLKEGENFAISEGKGQAVDGQSLKIAF